MTSIGEPERIIIVEPLCEPVPQVLPGVNAEPIEAPEEVPVEI